GSATDASATDASATDACATSGRVPVVPFTAEAPHAIERVHHLRERRLFVRGGVAVGSRRDHRYRGSTLVAEGDRVPTAGLPHDDHVGRLVGRERVAGARAAGRLLAHGTDQAHAEARRKDRKSTRLNSSHVKISYAVFCLKKKTRIKS